MKPLRPNVLILHKLFGFAGLVFAAAISQAATLYSNNFEGAEAVAIANGAGPVPGPTLYAYGNQGGWTQVLNGGATKTYWWYSTKYAGTGFSPGRPDPLGPASAPYDTNGQGATALHGINAAGFRYATRTLGDTFSAGVYKLSVDVSTDNGLASQGTWLYLYDGSAAAPTDFDNQSFSAVGFLSAGGGSQAGTPTGSIGNIVAPAFNSASDAGNWQTVSYEFTPSAAAYGKPVAIGLYVRSQTALDNVRLEFTPVPEPATGALALGALVFLGRRRRSGQPD